MNVSIKLALIGIVKLALIGIGIKFWERKMWTLDYRWRHSRTFQIVWVAWWKLIFSSSTFEKCRLSWNQSSVNFSIGIHQTIKAFVVLLSTFCRLFAIVPTCFKLWINKWSWQLWYWNIGWLGNKYIFTLSATYRLANVGRLDY